MTELCEIIIQTNVRVILYIWMDIFIYVNGWVTHLTSNTNIRVNERLEGERVIVLILIYTYKKYKGIV